ncbi:hypothetical protein IWX91DRAFT_325859 [Phyllosticta citricarpa]
MVLPPLAILIPRAIRLLELLVDVYAIVAPCVGCALRGCFGESCCCGGGERDNDKKKPNDDDGCDCPARPTDLKKEDSSERNERTSCLPWNKGKSKEKRRRRLHKDPPPGFELPCQGRVGDEEIDADADAELAALQRQYSTLPQPPSPSPSLTELRQHRGGV